MGLENLRVKRASLFAVTKLLALLIMCLPAPAVWAVKHALNHAPAPTTKSDTARIPANYIVDADENARQMLLNALRPSTGALPSENARSDNARRETSNQVRLGSEFVEKNILPLLEESTQGRGVDTRLLPTVSLSLPNDRKIERVQQYFQGIEVFQNQVTVLYGPRDIPLMSSGSVSKAKPINPAALTGPSRNANLMADAIAAAYIDLSGTKFVPTLSTPAIRGAYTSFVTEGEDLPYRVDGDARAKPVWYALENLLIPAYYVEIQITPNDSGVFLGFAYVIEQASQRILLRVNQTANDTAYGYRGFFKDASTGTPAQGPHGDVIPKVDPSQPDVRELDNQVIANVSNWGGAQTDDPWLTSDMSEAILEEFYGITGLSSIRTAGNNVIAYADRAAPDGFNEGDFLPASNDEGNFDYLLDRSLEDTSDQNAGAAAVNMFVVNNYLHDWWYQLKLFDGEEAIGFNEQFGNAQFSNYGRGGEEKDPIKAEAQDYDGINNANMFTPADGSSPRMQQYFWYGKWINGIDYGVRILSPLRSEYLDPVQGPPSFGPLNFDLNDAEVVLVADTGDTSQLTDPDLIWQARFDGCEALAPEGSLKRKVLLLSRGSCSFTQKVRNAQDAGAAGALIFNNVDDGTAAPMGGIDPEIVVPSVGLTFNDGATLRALIEENTSPTVRMFLRGSLNDSSFDNGIVAHEWGHYMQNRMIGNGAGLFNSQGRAMGEGWADFHSLMFLVEASQSAMQGNETFQKPYATGTYVEDFYTGIRRAPYTPDMSINPLTFEHIIAGAEPPGLVATNNISPHSAGEMWAAVLWDLYVELLNRYDFEEAQNRMALYLFAGYAFTPIAPTYTEARDAILYFILSWDQVDYDAAVSVFARRGLGFGAVSPPRYSLLDPGTAITESYSADTAGAAVTSTEFVQNLFQDENNQCTANNILDAGETGFVRISVQNTGGTTVDTLEATITAQLPQQVSFPEGNTVDLPSIPQFSDTSILIPVTLLDNDLGASVSLEISVSGNAAGGASIPISNATSNITLTTNYGGTLRSPQNGADLADIESLAWRFDLRPVFDVPLTPEQTVSSMPVQDTLNTSFFAGFNPGVSLGSATLLLPNTDFGNDYSVETVPFLVSSTEPFTVSFWHFYWIEEGWDGGVIEISVDGGDWQDVTEVGGSFSVGYAGPLNFLLPGRETYTGTNGDFDTFMGGPEEIAFGTSLAGSTVKLRFRMVSDLLVSDIGWVIDNLSISGLASSVFHNLVMGDSVPCDSSPSITTPPPQPSIERFDYESSQILLYVSEDSTGPVAGYTAICTEVGNPLISVSAVSETPLIVVGGLKNEVAYTCRVSAYNDEGASSASPATAPIIPEALPTGLPVWLIHEVLR